ncbi:unnamed protein product [Phyllotreta striolata]|uniref:Uncharacterized protein n=1 Tax=Phyllotreta striolata TaxID=444603 RepID=A0A9N9XLS8_PHYSR|nr:unnamed protein product [Phyllotreta striolata]
MVFAAFAIVGLVLFASYAALKKLHERLKSRVFRDFLRELYASEARDKAQGECRPFEALNPEIIQLIKGERDNDSTYSDLRKANSCVELPRIALIRRGVSDL